MADAPRLFLITPPIADAAAFVPLLEAALGATDVACVLVRTAAPDERSIKAVAGLLAPVAQRSGAAVLVEGEGRLAARIGADGVHVAGNRAAIDEALAALKPDKIVGVGGLVGRDAAMMAGEAGVDYLMFGGPEARLPHLDICAQVEWWAEIFNVPCVGYATHPDRAGEIAAAGAEFVALCEGLWERPEAIAVTLSDVSKVMRPMPEAVR